LAYYTGSVVEITEPTGHLFWWWITKQVKTMHCCKLTTHSLINKR